MFLIIWILLALGAESQVINVDYSKDFELDLSTTVVDNKLTFDSVSGNSLNDLFSSDNCYFIIPKYRLCEGNLRIFPNMITGIYQTITEYKTSVPHIDDEYDVGEFIPIIGGGFNIEISDNILVYVSSNTYYCAEFYINIYF